MLAPFLRKESALKGTGPQQTTSSRRCCAEFDRTDRVRVKSYAHQHLVFSAVQSGRRASTTPGPEGKALSSSAIAPLLAEPLMRCE